MAHFAHLAVETDSNDAIFCRDFTKGSIVTDSISNPVGKLKAHAVVITVEELLTRGGDLADGYGACLFLYIYTN